MAPWNYRGREFSLGYGKKQGLNNMGGLHSTYHNRSLIWSLRRFLGLSYLPSDWWTTSFVFILHQRVGTSDSLVQGLHQGMRISIGCLFHWFWEIVASIREQSLVDQPAKERRNHRLERSIYIKMGETFSHTWESPVNGLHDDFIRTEGWRTSASPVPISQSLGLGSSCYSITERRSKFQTFAHQ